MTNPFTLSFGRKPIQFISRLTQTNDIIENFNSPQPSNQMYVLLGVRGSGKTVLMTTISGKLAENKNWITVELNPNKDLLQGLAAKLYSMPELSRLFIKAKLDLSLFGIGISIENAIPISDIETAIHRMLEQINAAGKKLLITIDEISKNEYVKTFASSFQIFLRNDYPVFLLMTGLYENILKLQNDESLTFLYRAPKVFLEPLNFTAVRSHYQKIFNLSIEEAEQMTILTKGYSFAFQVLGYLCWEHDACHKIDEILPEYDQYLSEYVYEKIWFELSELDKKIILEMSASDTIKTKELRKKINMTSEKFSVYRDRLKRKGIINTSEYGSLSFALPRFGEFSKSRFFDL